MILDLHNIGCIHHASIHIGGLTVLTGYNDSGKSTIGKVLFGLIKASNNAEEEYKENKYIYIKDKKFLREIGELSDYLSGLSEIYSSIEVSDKNIDIEESIKYLDNEEPVAKRWCYLDFGAENVMRCY